MTFTLAHRAASAKENSAIADGSGRVPLFADEVALQSSLCLQAADSANKQRSNFEFGPIAFRPWVPPARRVSLFEPAGALGSIMVSGAQIRAARGLLGWTTRELARRATVSVSTVQLIENAGGSPNASREALAAVQNTLEAEGIEFLVGDAPGVRLYPKKR
jgi:DNA-binding XRE family transcriptional regulator